jgi:hypothetical protein
MTSYNVAFLSPDPVTIYLSSVEMSRQVIQVYPNVVKSNNAHAVSSSLLESGLTLIINTSFRLTSDIVKWHEKGVNWKLSLLD